MFSKKSISRPCYTINLKTLLGGRCGTFFSELKSRRVAIASCSQQDIGPRRWKGDREEAVNNLNQSEQVQRNDKALKKYSKL